MAAMSKHLSAKRVYEEPAPDDGERVLIDRLWPRGLTKEKAHVDLWLKDIAPSRELRTWFGHDPEKYDEFRRRFEAELAEEPARTALETLREHIKKGPVTLVYAAHDSAHSNASVLLKLLGA